MLHASIESWVEHPDATCVLLVHPDVRVLQRHAQDTAATLGIASVSVARELSRVLLNEPSQARPRLARSWLSDTATHLAPALAVLTDIDLLFEPAWALDPLALFRSASRSARLIVAWPGTTKQGTLAYGVPEHSAYRTWHHPGVHIIDLT